MTIPRILAGLALFALAACSSDKSETGQAPAERPAPLTQLRIGIDAAASGECSEDSASWPEAQRRYARHLQKRMEVPVSFCPLVGPQAIANAIADGKVEIGLIDGPAYLPVKDRIRPILAVRPDTGPGRAITVVVVPDKAADRSLADLVEKSRAGKLGLILSSENAEVLGAVRRGLTVGGIAPDSLAKARLEANAKSAADALRSGDGDAVGVGAAEWYRYCRGVKKDDKPCGDLREVWRGREPVAQAWAVRRDISPESWARLVGIHVALFQEEPVIARWLAPGAREITPVEASALETASK